MTEQGSESDSCQPVMMKEEIKEEVNEDLMSSPRRKRKVKVTVVKVKMEVNAPAPALQLKKEDVDIKESRQPQRANVKSSYSTSSLLQLAYWGKRRSKKTPEQLRKGAENARRCRQRKMDSMTPEEWKKKEAEKRQRRKKRMSLETREKRAEKCREYRNRKKETMTPSQYEEYRRKENARLRKYHKPKCTKLERLGLSPEEIKERQRELSRRKREEMTEGEKEELRREKREAMKKWKKNLSKEAKEKQRFYKFYIQQMKLARMTQEERQEWTRRNTESARKWRKNLPPDRLEKYNEYMKRQVKKRIEKMKRERPEEYLKQMRVNTRKWVANQTPEQRQRRLRRYQINAAATKLRKQLLEDGLLPQAEVEKQVEDLKRKMWEEPLLPLETISSYKPRPRRNPKYPDSDEAITATAIPKRRRGRLWGSTIRKRTPSPKPVQTEATLLSPAFDAIDDFHDHSLDSSYFHEDSSSVTVTPADTSIRDMEETELIVQFDLECPHCPSTYLEKSDLLAHVSSEHPSQCWKCPLCRSIVLSPAELQQHFKSEHSNASSTSAPKRSNNASTARNEANVTSELSNDDSIAASDISVIGTQSQAVSKTFKCIKCIESDIAFESHDDLLGHFKSSHPESYWPCPKCNILKYTERSLSIHSKLCKGSSSSSIPDKPPNSVGLLLDCRKCHFVVKSQKDLRIHVKYTHPESYWLCLHCNEWKYSERSLYRHKESCVVINDSKEEVKTASTSSSRGRSKKDPKSTKKATRN